jgi:uncharacterized membrane protein
VTVDEAEFERLSARVDALEREVTQLRYGIGAPAAAAAPPAPPASVTQRVVAQPPAAPAQAAPTQAAPAPALRERHDVESMVGGRGLLYAGGLLILIGVASFLKIAFDRGWIGPPMRVALGLIAGAAVIGVASSMRKRLNPYFADGLVGIGAAIAYLSLYASGSMFHLLPVTAVSLGTIVVTATVCLLAYRQDRQPLAFFGIFGGIVAPLLMGGDGTDSIFLYTYLAVLSAGAMALGELRGWRAVPMVALVGSTLYWLLFSVDGDTHKLAERVTVGIVLYALFASTMILAWRKREAPDAWRIALASANAVWFFVGIAALAQGHDTILALVFLGVAAAHLLAGWGLKQRQQYWLATIAISFAIPPVCYSFSSIAPPQVVAGATHLAWIVEATLVGVLGVRWKDRVLAVLSGALFATAIIHTIALYGVSDLNTLFNDRFISLIASAFAIGYVRRCLRAAGMAGDKLLGVVRIAIDLIVLFAVTPEAERIGNALQPQGGYAGGSVAISIAWAIYGAVLIVLGIRTKDAVSRWSGLVLLAITVLKVLIVDLTELDIVFRVISALGLGVVMLVMAYLYQSRLRNAKDGQ